LIVRKSSTLVIIKEVALNIYHLIFSKFLKKLKKDIIVSKNLFAIPLRCKISMTKINFILWILEKERWWKYPLERMRWNPKLSPKPGWSIKIIFVFELLLNVISP